MVFSKIYGQYSHWWLYAVHGVDYFLSVFLVLILGKLAGFLGQLVAIAMSTGILAYRQMNKQLEQSIREYRSRKIDYHKFQLKIIWFLKTHHYQTTIFLKATSKFWSRLFFLGSIPNLLANVNLIADLFFSRNTLEKLTVKFLLCLVQTGLGICITAFVAQGSHSLHLPSHKMATALRLLRQRNFRLKWKMLNYFEVIHSNKKISVTFGPLGDITYAKLAEVRNRSRPSTSFSLIIFVF